MLVIKVKDQYEGGKKAFEIVKEAVEQGATVLGLATGSTPLTLYDEMKKSDLGKAAKMSPNTLSKMSRNEPVSLEILMRICKVLHCDIGDIMEITED